MTWIEGILIGLAANAIFAFLGWLLKSWVAPNPKNVRDPDDQFISPSDAISINVEQKVVIEHRVITYHQERKVTSESQDSDEGWGYLILGFIIIGALSAFWKAYKLPLLVVTGLGVILGWTSSFYFATILRKIPGKLRWDDIALSWGSMAIWTIAIFAFVIGVYEPYYPSFVAQDKLSIMLAEAFQAIGAGLLLLSIFTMTILQFVSGSIYRKVLSDRLANRFEVWLWSNRLPAVLLVVFSLIFGAAMVSGIIMYIYPS